MTAADRDEQLLRALYDRYATSLWWFVLRLTGGDRARSHDVVQETMLRAWRHPAVLDEQHRAARSWLFTVARNVVIDDWRTRRSRLELSTGELPEDAQRDQTDELLQTWMVADALSQLSEDHRQVLVECYYRGRSVADAAQRLGIPAGTVKSRTHYALRALRLALEEMGVQS